MSQPNPLRRVIENSFKENGVSVRPKFVTSDISTQYELIKNNFGIGFVSKYSWLYNDFSDTCLSHLKLNKIYRNIYLSYHPSKEEKYHKQVKNLIISFFNELSDE